MRSCFICLGSNYDAPYYFKKAYQFLITYFPQIRFSSLETTVPIDYFNPSPFNNQMALFETDKSAIEIETILKQIEKNCGRIKSDKDNGIVRIDIDLIIYDNKVLRINEISRDYIQSGIAQLKALNNNKMKFIGIIPARYASTRFPAKPLAILQGKTVIQRVYEQVIEILDDAYVATDDERIKDVVESFNGKVIMTSTEHKSGTDRCYEAFTKIAGDYDVIINIQGDEPFIQHTQLQSIKDCFLDAETQIATLVKPFSNDALIEDIENPNSPKVVINNNHQALYFSRSVIPYLRGIEKCDWTKHHTFYKHIGLYAYKKEVLKEITSLPQSKLELAESLEQLRWLENGYIIKVGFTDIETIGIDTPEDLHKAELFLEKQNHG